MWILKTRRLTRFLQMTSLNLAVVFAPTVMRPETVEKEMSDMQAQRVAVQCLLDMNQAIFAGGGNADE